MSRPANPQLVESIIKLSLKAIQENGAQNLSMRSLADQANITPTTIYYYFKNKDDLMEQINLWGINNLDDYINARIKPRSSPKIQLRQLITAFIDWCIKNHFLAEVLFENMTPNPGFNPQTIRKYYRTFFRASSIIKAGNETGDFTVENENMFVTVGFAWLYGLVNLHIHNTFIPDHRNKLDELINYVLDFIFKQIETPKINIMSS